MKHIRKLQVALYLAIIISDLAAARTVAIAQNNSHLVFDIGVTKYRKSGWFYQGEPICVRAGVRRRPNNREATDIRPLQVGAKILPWYENITFTIYRIEKKEQSVKSTENIITHDGKTEASKMRLLVDDISVEKFGPQPNKNKLKLNEIARSFWVIPPNVTSNLPPGEYTIQALFDTSHAVETNKEIFQVKLASSEILFALKKSPTDNRARAEIAKSQARFFEFQGKYREAVVLLEQAKHLDPSAKDIFCRLGRAYELQGDISNAIREYQVYLDWARKQSNTGKDGAYEHADTIESTVRALKRRLAKGQ